MNIEAELSLMAAPIVEWVSSVNKHTFAWSVIGVVFSVIFRTAIARAIFAAWYNLAAVFLSALNPKQLNNLVAETDWAVRVTRFVIILLGITALLQLWNIDVSAAFTGVGVLGAGVAIAAQDILKNFFGGMSNVSESIS
jgi:MscS family membrane protein